RSGPAAGAKVPALPVFAATGAHENKELDYAAERKDRPTIYLIVQGAHFDRPIARFMKSIDKDLAEGKAKAEAVAVWLTENQDETKERLPKVKQSLQFQAAALAVSTGDTSGPKDWGVNDMAPLTVVVAHDGKVAATFAYRTVNEMDAPAVIKALRKAV